MALGYAIGSIAGVALEDGSGTPCKTLILDGANLLATVVASTQLAADGTPYTQALATTKGARFGVRIEYLPPDVLNAIVTAINVAVGAGEPFQVALEDDIHDIDLQAIPDFEAGWLQYPGGRTNPDVIKDVTLRFITA